jgi:hypothetical protein
MKQHRRAIAAVQQGCVEQLVRPDQQQELLSLKLGHPDEASIAAETTAMQLQINAACRSTKPAVQGVLSSWSGLEKTGKVRHNLGASAAGTTAVQLEQCAQSIEHQVSCA